MALAGREESCRAVPTKCTPPTFQANAYANRCSPSEFQWRNNILYTKEDTAEKNDPTRHSSRSWTAPDSSCQAAAVEPRFPPLSLRTSAGVYCMNTLKHVPRTTVYYTA